jgi:hypothetical protein
MKNRYVSVIPCTFSFFLFFFSVFDILPQILFVLSSDDKTRVVLKKANGMSDYINANYIQVAPKKEKKRHSTIKFLMFLSFLLRTGTNRKILHCHSGTFD